jgi:glutamate decarboxylase
MGIAIGMLASRLTGDSLTILGLEENIPERELGASTTAGMLSRNGDSTPLPAASLHPAFNVHERSAHDAYATVNALLENDISPTRNMGTFGTVAGGREDELLMLQGAWKNLVNKDEYRGTDEVHTLALLSLSALFHAPEALTASKPDDNGDVHGVSPDGDMAIEGHLPFGASPTGVGYGTATVGSSEAIMLAGVAMKNSWRERNQALGLPTDKPNIVVPSTTHNCWDKLGQLFDIEVRHVEMHGNAVGIPDAMALVNENTICIVGTLGTTYTGAFDDIEALNDAVSEWERKNPTLTLPIHVDAASGGFVAPFAYPDLKWDFRLKHVASINVSGHKYGLVSYGIGWLVFRDRAAFPDELEVQVDYLAGSHPSFTINFSRSSWQVAAQFYKFLHLDHQGYTAVMTETASKAVFMKQQLTENFNGAFILRNGPQAGFHGDDVNAPSLPVVVASVAPGLGWDEYDLADALKSKGWMVPASQLPGFFPSPEGPQKLSVLRMVMKVGLTREDLEVFLHDLHSCVNELTIAAVVGDSNSDAFYAVDELGYTNPNLTEGSF